MPQAFKDEMQLLKPDRADNNNDELIKDPNSITDSITVDLMSPNKHLQMLKELSKKNIFAKINLIKFIRKKMLQSSVSTDLQRTAAIHQRYLRTQVVLHLPKASKTTKAS